MELQSEWGKPNFKMESGYSEIESTANTKSPYDEWVKPVLSRKKITYRQWCSFEMSRLQTKGINTRLIENDKGEIALEKV